MSTLHKQPTPEELRLLSAYIDGELSSSESAELKARLENDPALQAELASLRQTVELVRTLPRMTAPHNFTLDPAVYQKQAPAKITRFSTWRMASAVSLAASVVLIIAGMLLIGTGDDATEPTDVQPLSERDDATLQSLELTREAVMLTADPITPEPTATATVEIHIESLPEADDYDGLGPGEGFAEGATGLGAGEDDAVGDDFPPVGDAPMMPPGAADNGFGGGDNGRSIPPGEFGPMYDMPSPAPTQAPVAESAEAADAEQAEEDTFAAADEAAEAEEEAAEVEDTMADDATEEEMPAAAVSETQMRSADVTEMSAAQAEDGASEPAAPIETEEPPVEEEDRGEVEDDADEADEDDDNTVAIALLIAGVLGTVVSGGVLFYTWRRPSAKQA